MACILLEGELEEGGKKKERNETKSESVGVKTMITFLTHNLLHPGRI